MDVVAKSRFVRMSPTKARDMARKLRGLTAEEALRLTEFSARKAATDLGKPLRSAIANAENNAQAAVEDLRIREAVVEGGPGMRRYWPRARGGVSRIRRPMCHIRIVLTDGKDEEEAPEDSD